MEYLWYIIAALGAGVGTGLAGLSAATVMVPILIVLCPSFGGDTGAYQATAIALASDVLGSAVTTYTYAKHKNIDLKRGWLMLVCIIGMCTVGSFAAWAAGNVVLGGFTLFLTFCIGIRFLVKPDTSRKHTAAKGETLDGKGVAVSLFFGLTIGFGTGFVGTGGGMMMLVVFTAFLGMELKTAVGTSTFIMTFTALIASVSHILIHPAIVLEKWDVMLLCIIAATASSLVSARFANRVGNRAVGLVTGTVLTALGAAMILLNYWDFIVSVPLLRETLRCLGVLALYILPCVAVLAPVHFLTKIPQFVFRKLLHIVAFSCVTVMILLAPDWRAPAIASCAVAFAVYPALAVLEREPWYAGLLAEKKPGEVKKSLCLYFFTIAVVVAFAWGAMGHRDIAVAAILIWGIGDAAAALVGIPFGKHKITWALTDGKKSWEGTLAMFAAAFAVGFPIMLFVSDAGVWPCLLRAAVGAAVAAFVELISKDGADTITVPLSVTVTLWLLSLI